MKFPYLPVGEAIILLNDWAFTCDLKPYANRGIVTYFDQYHVAREDQQYGYTKAFQNLKPCPITLYKYTSLRVDQIAVRRTKSGKYLRNAVTFVLTSGKDPRFGFKSRIKFSVPIQEVEEMEFMLFVEPLKKQKQEKNVSV